MMLEVAREYLRERIAVGDSPEVVDAEVAEAAPRMDEEEQAALWLYAWHLAGADRVGP